MAISSREKGISHRLRVTSTLDTRCVAVISPRHACVPNDTFVGSDKPWLVMVGCWVAFLLTLSSAMEVNRGKVIVYIIYELIKFRDDSLSHRNVSCSTKSAKVSY